MKTSTVSIKKLKDICKIVSGATPKTVKPEYWDGDIPWVTPKDLSSLKSIYLSNPERAITKAGFDSCSTQMIPAKSVLLSSRAPIGHLAINEVEVCTNQGFKSLIPSKEIYPEYLYFCIKYFVPQLKNLGRGATFTEISKDIVENFEIPVVPLEQQKAIALRLSESYKLIELSEQRLSELDNYLRSLFIEMFGDPVSNSLGYPLEQLSKVCTKVTDGTHDTPERTDAGKMFITGKNIRPFKFDLSDLEYVADGVHREIFERCDPAKGDVLITNIGAGVGNAVFNNFNEEFSMKNVALLKPRNQVLDGRYLESLLNLPHMKSHLLEQNQQGGAQKFLSLNTLRNIKIPLPGIDAQKSYAAQVENCFLIKQQMENSSEELNSLFQSLLAESFSGAL